MKLTIVNTTDIRGGAAIAAFRLFKVMHNRLPETKMLVNEKLTEFDDVIGLDKTLIRRFLIKFRFYYERISYIIRASSRDFWFSFSPANSGRNINNLPEIQNADIVHVHWINGGFLSLRSLGKLLKTGKPVVWTLQDMWAFTGGCHYAGTCTNYLRACGNCKYLKFNSQHDLSHRILKKKLKIYKSANLNIIGSSRWIADCASKSTLLSGKRIVVLPNPIDTNIYKPADKNSVRRELNLPEDKFLLLSGAANFKDKRKGFHYLLEALKKMAVQNPAITESFGLITFGKASDVEDCPIPVYSQPYLKEDSSIAKLYQSADVFILPTLEDNLPSTVLESLSCSTPVVAFNTGGIPDMVDHLTNGYLAELYSTDELINGINWVHNNPELEKIRNNCRQKIMTTFSPEVVSKKYLDFYKSLL